MRTRFDLDQARKDRSRSIMKRILIQEIAGRIWLLVVLQGALIELLLIPCHADCQHVAARTAFNHSADALETRIFSPKVQGKVESRGVLLCDGGVHLNGDKVSAPLLNADVVELGTRLQNEVIPSAAQSASFRILPNTIF